MSKGESLGEFLLGPAIEFFTEETLGATKKAGGAVRLPFGMCIRQAMREIGTESGCAPSALATGVLAFQLRLVCIPVIKSFRNIG